MVWRRGSGEVVKGVSIGQGYRMFDVVGEVELA